jgi:hypothetical protein
MPETLTSLMGGSMPDDSGAAQGDTAIASVPKKKKLRKVGTVYTDDDGNWYPAKHYDNGDTTAYESQSEAEKANEGPGIDNRPEAERVSGVDKTATSAMGQAVFGKPQQKATSAMGGAPKGDDTYKKAEEAYISGDYQGAYDAMAGAMKDPSMSNDARFKKLWKRVKVALNIE